MGGWGGGGVARFWCVVWNPSQQEKGEKCEEEKEKDREIDASEETT